MSRGMGQPLTRVATGLRIFYLEGEMSKIESKEIKANSRSNHPGPSSKGTSQESVARSLRTCYEMGMKAFEQVYGKAPRDLWERYSWGDPEWIDVVMAFTRARYKRLAALNKTPREAIKNAVELLTCPVTISPEHGKFGTDAANIGEFLTLGLLAVIEQRANAPDPLTWLLAAA